MCHTPPRGAGHPLGDPQGMGSHRGDNPADGVRLGRVLGCPHPQRAFSLMLPAAL